MDGFIQKAFERVGERLTSSPYKIDELEISETLPDIFMATVCCQDRPVIVCGPAELKQCGDMAAALVFDRTVLEIMQVLVAYEKHGQAAGIPRSEEDLLELRNKSEIRFNDLSWHWAKADQVITDPCASVSVGPLRDDLTNLLVLCPHEFGAKVATVLCVSPTVDRIFRTVVRNGRN